MKSKFKTAGILLGTLLIMVGYQNCGQGFEDVGPGSEESSVIGDIFFDENISKTEKLSTDIHSNPSMNSIYREGNTNNMIIKIYKGQRKNLSRFNKFNLFMDGRYIRTATHCTSSARYCLIRLSFLYMITGQDYKFQVSGIDLNGDWTPQVNSATFTIPEKAGVASVASTQTSNDTVSVPATAAASTSTSSESGVNFRKSGHYKSFNPSSNSYRTFIVVGGKLCENPSGEIRDKYNTQLLTQEEKTAMIRLYANANKYFDGAPCR